MNKPTFVILSLFFVWMSSFGQTPKTQTLLIVDSISVENTQGLRNQIPAEEIADSAMISDKDSLKLLGWDNASAATFLFTKEYRKRSDSVRKIPSLRQMVRKDGSWYWRGNPYSGRFIDYYLDGKIESEGRTLNGQLNGEVVLYYKNGAKQFITNYDEGTRHGIWKQYFKNGALMAENRYDYGKVSNTGKSYFINGQLRYEFRSRKGTREDTSIIYYSSGKVREIEMSKSGRFYPDRKEENLKYYSQLFYEHLWEGDVKKANKDFYKIWQTDSASLETHFKEGQLLAYELRFNDAIAAFDKALAMEPFMLVALEQRIVARLKKYRVANRYKALKDQKEIPPALEDFMVLPEDEKAKVCQDLLLMDSLDPNNYYSIKTIPETILKYCDKKAGH